MARKRKVVVPEVVPEAAPVKKITELHTIVQCTQKSETFHNKYLKDLQNVYAKYKHEEFVKIFTGILSSAMQRDETHEFANTALSFCAKFITSFAEVDDEETHPMMTSIFNWLLSVSFSKFVKNCFSYFFCFLSRTHRPINTFDSDSVNL